MAERLTSTKCNRSSHIFITSVLNGVELVARQTSNLYPRSCHTQHGPSGVVVSRVTLISYVFCGSNVYRFPDVTQGEVASKLATHSISLSPNQSAWK